MGSQATCAIVNSRTTSTDDPLNNCIAQKKRAVGWGGQKEGFLEEGGHEWRLEGKQGPFQETTGWRRVAPLGVCGSQTAWH